MNTFKAFGPAVDKSWLLNSWFLLRDEGNCTGDVSCKVAINQIPPVRIVVVPLPWDGTYGFPRALATTDRNPYFWKQVDFVVMKGINKFLPEDTRFHGSIPYWNARFSSILQGNLAFHGLFWSSISLQQTTQRLGRRYSDRFWLFGFRARKAWMSWTLEPNTYMCCPFFYAGKDPIWPIFFELKPPTGIFVGCVS